GEATVKASSISESSIGVSPGNRVLADLAFNRISVNKPPSTALERECALLAKSGRALTLETQASGQYLAEVAGIKVVGLRPDLLIAQDGQPIAIEDTK